MLFGLRDHDAQRLAMLQLMAEVVEDPEVASPSEFARMALEIGEGDDDCLATWIEAFLDTRARAVHEAGEFAAAQEIFKSSGRDLSEEIDAYHAKEEAEELEASLPKAQENEERAARRL